MKKTLTKVTTFILAAAGLAGLVVAGAGFGRSRTQAVPAREAADEAPAVTTVRPERHALERSTEQPGQIEGYEQSPLYPKIAGYVEKLNVDIGDRVTRGQVLAELSVPEVVEEHRQKQAT